METTAMTRDEKYNGWKNYQTWNVALWIQNDETLYGLARELARDGFGYKAFMDEMRGGLGVTETPDGVAYNDSGLDVDALDAMIDELAG